MAKKLFLGFVCLVFLVSAPICAFSSEKKAATNELSQEKINFIFNWVKEGVGHKAKVTPPKVEFVSRIRLFKVVLNRREELFERILKEKGPQFLDQIFFNVLWHTFSFTAPDGKNIYVQNFLPTVKMETTLVYAYTYFFQYLEEGAIVFENHTGSFRDKIRIIQREKMQENYLNEFYSKKKKTKNNERENKF